MAGPSDAQVKRYIVQIARQMRIPPEMALAVAQFESGFEQRSVSSAGAIGIFQLMPGTARGLGVNPHNWRENVEGGVKYLRIQFRQFNNWHDAYAAYNAGPGNYQVNEAQRNATEVLRIAKREYGFKGGRGSIPGERAGDGDGGGGGGGGKAGGGGRSPMMAGKGVAAKVTRNELGDVLRGFGLRPSLFQPIIDKAVREGWSDVAFLAAVYQSKPFKRTFPGITREDGSVRMSPMEYLSMRDRYGHIADNYGVNMSRKLFGRLVAGDVSEDEWMHRAQITQAARSTPELRRSFDEILTSKERRKLDDKGWWDFLEGHTESELYDLYEEFELGRYGLDINRKDSANIGDTGEFLDLAALAREIRKIQSSIGPELANAGISDADLAILESGGRDDKGLQPKLQQLLRNREALVGAGLPSRSVTEGGGIFAAASEGR